MVHTCVGEFASISAILGCNLLASDDPKAVIYQMYTHGRPEYSYIGSTDIGTGDGLAVYRLGYA